MIGVSGFPSADPTLDFHLAPGEVVRLQGPNGSGKTSLLRALAGLDAAVSPQSVTIHGEDPRRLPASNLTRLVRFVPQDARDALAGLTVGGEFRLRGHRAPTALAALASRDVATLSTGESRRLGLALAGSDSTPLLLLDEPFEGLDTEGRARVRQLIAATRDSGGAVLLVDHDGALQDLATRTIRLAPDAPDVGGSFLPRSGRPAVVLEAPSASVRRGDSRIDTPAISLPAGLHALIGPNGAGKSSFFLHLAGLLGPTQACVDSRPARCGDNLRLLPPHARDLFIGPTVADELAGVAAEIRDALVPSELHGRHPLALSGGEQQRLALAITLGTAARVYLLDEPEAHLDAKGRAVMMRILARRIQEGACILVATHDSRLQSDAHSTRSMGSRE